MNKTQLIKQALEDFFYKIRVNVALRDVLKSDRCASVAKMFSLGIKKQLSMYTKKEVINDIVGFYKGELRQITNPELYDGVMRHWIPLLSIIDQDELNDYLVFASTRGGQSALDKLKIDQKFVLLSESSLKNINIRSSESLALIEQTTQLWVVKIINDALKESLSPEEIAKLVKSAINKASSNRGELIAEHEATLAIGEMELEVYRRSGVAFIRWITARDELTCEICMGNEEAGAIETGTLFPSGVTTTPAHHRCRCLILPVEQDEIKNIWIGQ
jgi:SPP1 gp7 family putative phage head morphogenesis protein